MSLDVSGSWTVREVREFAADFNKIEDRVTKAIVAVSMLVIGPIALSMLVLMDAIRGANHLVESLYWRDKSVEPARNTPAPALPSDPIKEILDDVAVIKAKAANPGELEQKKIALVGKVLEAIQEKRMNEEQAAAFIVRVIQELGEDFGQLFGREAVKRMREEFLADFIGEPLDAVTRVQNMGLLLERVFPGFDKERVLGREDVIPIMNAIRSELRSNLALSVEMRNERAAQLGLLVDVMKTMGFPKNYENFVAAMRDELYVLAGMIQNRRRMIEPIALKLQELDEHAEAIAELKKKIEEEEAAVRTLSREIPKEREFHSATDLKTRPENPQESQEILQKQIDEFQKEIDRLGEDGEKFREISPKRDLSQKRLDDYRKELGQRQAALKILLRDQFGGASGERLAELIGALQAMVFGNLREIDQLQREIERPVGGEDIVELVR